MTYDYDYLIFIGRFMPWHAGHQHIAKRALDLSRNLILVMGSHNLPRSSRNPLTTAERIQIISSCFTKEELERIHFVPQENFLYNDTKWIASLTGGVSAVTWNISELNPWRAGPTKIGLIGRNKDNSSYYLKLFPHWASVEVSDCFVMDATAIREGFYDPVKGVPKWWVNDQHMLTTMSIFNGPALDIVKQEYEFIKKYKEQWEGTPYPPIFTTVDSIVVQSGHLLLVERGGMPGLGQLALPGGFIHQDETLLDASIRELKEETKLKVPVPVLKGSLVKQKVFDDPHRSLRGRTITNAFYYKLLDQPKLPPIKGSDDAKKAFWMPLSEVEKLRSKMFEDHFDICSEMIGF